MQLLVPLSWACHLNPKICSRVGVSLIGCLEVTPRHRLGHRLGIGLYTLVKNRKLASSSSRRCRGCHSGSGSGSGTSSGSGSGSGSGNGSRSSSRSSSSSSSSRR